MAYRSGKPGLPSLGNLRTPLEGVDLVADEINRLATLPGDVGASMFDAAGNAINQIKADIAAPRMQAERPIPPGTLLAPIPAGIGDIVSGVVGIVKSGVDGVITNVQGAKGELDTFIRG